MRETMCARPTASKIDFEIGSSLLSSSFRPRMLLIGAPTDPTHPYHLDQLISETALHGATYHLSERSDYPSFSAFYHAATRTGQDLLGVKQCHSFAS